MKKRIMALALALSLVFSMFTVFAVASSAYDLSGLTLAVTDAEKEAALAAKNTIAAVYPVSKTNPTGNYLGFFIFYGTQITMDKYTSLPEVIRFNETLKRCTALLETDTLYLAKYYGTDDSDVTYALQAGWNAARENVPVSNGWNNFRFRTVNEKCGGLWQNPVGVDANHIACTFYTAESWKVYYDAICWGDTYKTTCTDVDGEKAIQAIIDAYNALVKNPDYVGPVNAENKAAFDFCTANVSGKALFEWYSGRMNLFSKEEIWTDADTVNAFLDKATEAEEAFLEDYNDGYDYKQWVVYGDDGAPADMILEKLWTNARQCAYIGPVLKELRNKITDTILPSYFYTADSWSVWESVRDELSLKIDDISNGIGRKIKDVDGKAAIDAYQAAANELELVILPATTEAEKAAAQAAKDALNASAANPTGTFFGWYVGYGDKFTLEKYTSLAPVAAFKNQIEIVKYLLSTDTLYLAQYYGLTAGTEYDLESLWKAARALAPVSNNLITMRNDYLNANVTDWLQAYQDGFSTVYTDESFAAIRTLINRADANKGSYNDAQGDQYMADLAAAAAALVLRDPAIADKDNYIAYKKLESVVGTYAPLLKRFKLDESKATAEYIAFEAQVTTMDDLSIKEYDANVNYKVYTADAAEALWNAARKVAYIGPVLIELRTAILATIGDEIEYTVDSWASWLAVKTDLINLIDETKNSPRATDKDGKDAIAALQDAVNELVKKSTPLDGLKEATTEEEKAAAQAAKDTLNAVVETTSTGTYFGYYLDYMNRITLEANRNLPAVKAYMAQLEITKALLETDTLYIAGYYGLVTGVANDLEALWKAAREACLLNDGLTKARNEYLTANVKDWLEAYTMNFSCAYTNESFKAIRTMIDKADTIKRSCTDAEAAAYMEELKAAVAALVKRDPEIDLTNYKAYLELIKTYNTFAPLLNKFKLDESKATDEYKAFKAIIDEIEVHAINDYAASVAYGSYSSSSIEQIWFKARDVAYMGDGLIRLRNQIINDIGSSDKYTSESWDIWLTVKTGLIDAIDELKNSPTATDVKGKAAIDDLKAAIADLEKIAVRGDANGDGVVDIADAVLSFQYLAGKATIEDTDAFISTADIDGNGSVTLVDVIRLFRFVAGKTTEL